MVGGQARRQIDRPSHRLRGGQREIESEGARGAKGRGERKRQRDRERERDGQTETQRKRERWTDRNTEGDTERDREETYFTNITSRKHLFQPHLPLSFKSANICDTIITTGNLG